MGYSHYVYRKKELNKEDFKRTVEDFKKVLPTLQSLGVELASWNGSGQPEITDDEISFNGVENCGHEQRGLGITWPTEDSFGIALQYEKGNNGQAEQTDIVNQFLNLGFSETEMITTGAIGRDASKDSDVGGKWFAGMKLKGRTCGGDCSHESFMLVREYELPEYLKNDSHFSNPDDGMFFTCCKTAYKPYDLAMNCALIIAAHHLKDQNRVSSDGTVKNWADASMICKHVLGYGDVPFKDGEE